MELRSSALDMARAPSGPKALPAKQSASANTHNYTPGYHRSDFHCSQGRLTANIQAGERGVAFQRTRYGTCTLRPNFVACKHVSYMQQRPNTVACSTTRHAKKQSLTEKPQFGYAGVELQHARDGAPSFLAEIIVCNTKSRHDRASQRHTATHAHRHPSPPSIRNL